MIGLLKLWKETLGQPTPNLVIVRSFAEETIAEIEQLTAERDEQKAGWAKCFKLAIHHQERAEAAESKLAEARKALEECASSYATPPGTIASCSDHIAREFQRRMQVAADALACLAQQDN